MSQHGTLPLQGLAKNAKLRYPCCHATHCVRRGYNVITLRGYNVITDNLFTSLDFARMLVDKQTSIVGTVKLNWREIHSLTPPPALYDSTFSGTSAVVSLVRNQANFKKQ